MTDNQKALMVAIENVLSAWGSVDLGQGVDSSVLISRMNTLDGAVAVVMAEEKQAGDYRDVCRYNLNNICGHPRRTLGCIGSDQCGVYENKIDSVVLQEQLKSLEQKLDLEINGGVNDQGAGDPGVRLYGRQNRHSMHQQMKRHNKLCDSVGVLEQKLNDHINPYTVMEHLNVKCCICDEFVIESGVAQGEILLDFPGKSCHMACKYPEPKGMTSIEALGKLKEGEVAWIGIKKHMVECEIDRYGGYIRMRQRYYYSADTSDWGEWSHDFELGLMLPEYTTWQIRKAT